MQVEILDSILVWNGPGEFQSVDDIPMEEGSQTFSEG